MNVQGSVGVAMTSTLTATPPPPPPAAAAALQRLHLGCISSTQAAAAHHCTPDSRSTLLCSV